MKSTEIGYFMLLKLALFLSYLFGFLFPHTLNVPLLAIEKTQAYATSIYLRL